ncbi:MAG TPA: DUF1579 family protein [Verrucomicrobiae bacterium]|jgi:hypothetical protein|nr:DUF1579 family protein [Verrucomicrobiae bacterium]
MKITVLTFSACLLLSAAAIAQSQMPTPGPDVKKLDYFAGTWSLDGDIKPGPMAPQGGKVTETEKCEWMQGNFYLVCHTDFGGSMGSGEGLSILGYSTDDKTYTYREFNSWGEFEDSKGAFDGQNWTWNSDEKTNGTAWKGRFTMKPASATSYSFMFEMSTDGGTKWMTVMDGKASKK